MKKTSIDHSARILRHGRSDDEITDEAIEIRARELALSDGRSGRDTTDQDRERALAELRGRTLLDTSLDNGESAGGLSQDAADSLALSGDGAPLRNEPAEEIQERLVLEGAEEARHDRMPADRRRSKP